MNKDIDVAAYIYSKTGWLDSWKLQKLTYYTQAWGLTWTGAPVFGDPIQAWDDGPVAPELYKINKYYTPVMSTELPGASADSLSASERAIVDSVLTFYGKMSRPELIERTHTEDPWRKAHDLGRNTEITKASMMGFYSKVSALGFAVPSRPELASTSITAAEFVEESRKQARIWAGTLELLAR